MQKSIKYIGCLLTLLSVIASADAAEYTIVDLGSGQPRGINNSNQVVGVNTNAPILWNYDGTNVTSVSLGILYDDATTYGIAAPAGAANAINDSGVVVGWSRQLVHTFYDEGIEETISYAQAHAFAWVPSSPNGTTGTMIDLTPEISSYGAEGPPPFDAFEYITEAVGINSTNLIVGNWYTYGLYHRGFTCITNGGIGTLLYPFSGEEYHESRVKGVNNLGLTTGVAVGDDTSEEPPQFYERGFIGTTNLACFQATTTAYTNSSWALAINNSNQVVGFSFNNANTEYYSCFWTNGTAVSIIQIGPTNNISHQAKAINDSGKIVGTQEDNKAYVYDAANGYRLLDDLIATNSGWSLQSAAGVNAAGYICGTGITNGQQRAFLLVPQ